MSGSLILSIRPGRLGLEVRAVSPIRPPLPCADDELCAGPRALANRTCEPRRQIGRRHPCPDHPDEAPGVPLDGAAVRRSKETPGRKHRSHNRDRPVPTWSRNRRREHTSGLLLHHRGRHGRRDQGRFKHCPSRTRGSVRRVGHPRPGPRSATVRTFTEVVAIRVQRDEFIKVATADPRVALRILEVLARRLRETTERLD